MQHFHFSQFSETQRLLEQKGTQRIAVCIPTLNEANTIGSIVKTIRDQWMTEVPLVDELWVIDSHSTDETLARAMDAGANAILSSEVAPDQGSFVGKGENLWKALHLTQADVICYLDGDVLDFHGGYVSGLVGPLLLNPTLHFIKAYYQRPLIQANQPPSPHGGRLTEILVRPMLSMFYPHLNEIIQPLSGEYAARRELLTSLSFPTGYGVEIAHLIDLWQSGRWGGVAQCDLVHRTHRNRSEEDLGDTAFALLQVIMRRLSRDGHIQLNHPLATEHLRWAYTGQQFQAMRKMIVENERPPFKP